MKEVKKKRCDECKSLDIGLFENKILFGENKGHWPFIWYCLSCGAAVHCHNGTYEATGRMACKHIRRMRKRAHLAFDKIWRADVMGRQEAYGWLAKELGISTDLCHFAKMGARHLKRAIKICEKFVDENVGYNKIKKERKDEQKRKRRESEKRNRERREHERKKRRFKRRK